MSRYIHIENALLSASDAQFQLICNDYLKWKYPGTLHSTGSVIGKLKVRKGKPDCYIHLDENKYIIAEHTTKDSKSGNSFKKKLSDDLTDLLNYSALGLKKKDIKLAVLCCNSNIEIGFEGELTKRAAENGIKLEIANINILTTYLLFYGARMANDVLNIPFDTLQILNKSDFLLQYDKRKLSTSLENKFIGRETELVDIETSISQNDFTIIEGQAGVGKTKLALEAIDQFLQSNITYHAYYIINSSGSLMDDLNFRIENDKNYIFFVDDANKQITSLLEIIRRQSLSTKQAIKIVATVRKHVKDAILKETIDIKKNIIDIQRLTDQSIDDILLNEASGLSSNTRSRILSISRGNPRFALMALIVLKESKSENFLEHVGNIYEDYFQIIRNENRLLENQNNLKTLGIISFFNTVDFKAQREIKLIESFGIKICEFIDAVVELERAEFVSLFDESTVKISEQTFAHYCFYIVFIKEKILAFSHLLTLAMPDFTYRLKDSFGGAVGTYGKENVFEVAKNDLKKSWKDIEADRKRKEDFIAVFGSYFPDYSFSLINELIEEDDSDTAFNLESLLTRKHSATYHGYDKIVGLLEPLLSLDDHYNLRFSYELLLKYLTKKHSSFNHVFACLKSNLAPDEIDSKSDFKRQKILLDCLTVRFKEAVGKYLFYFVFEDICLTSHYLNELYIKVGNGYQLSPQLSNLRKQYWEILIENYDNDKKIADCILVEYLRKLPYSKAVLVKFDYPFIIELINKKFDAECFDNCYYVQKYISGFTRYFSPSEELKKVQQKFFSNCYRVFLILSHQESISPKEFKEVRYSENGASFKEREIQNNLKIENFGQYLEIYCCIDELVRSRFDQAREIHYGVDTLFCLTFGKNTDLGLQVLDHYLNEGNILSYYPGTIYKKIFSIGGNLHKDFYALLKRTAFNCSDQWQERYFWYIPEDQVDDDIVQELLIFYKTFKSHVELYLRFLQKYLVYNSDILREILKVVAERKETNKGLSYKIEEEFLSFFPVLSPDDITFFETIYLQSSEMNNQFDYDCSTLTQLIRHDKGFLLRYIKWLEERSTWISTLDLKSISKVWDIDWIEDALSDVLDHFSSEHKYSSFDHPIKSFFVNLSETNQSRAFSLLSQKISGTNNERLINIVFEIVRNCLPAYYSILIKTLLAHNDNYDLFSQLEWNNNHFVSSGNQVWADFRQKELKKVKQAVEEMNQPLKYFRHIKLLNNKIEAEELSSLNERKDIFREYR